jgi:ribonuclease VapC
VIVDSSALIAILTDEPEGDAFLHALSAGGGRLSAASYLESGIVADRSSDPRLGRKLDALLVEADITIEPVTPHQARIARAAHRDFGRGSGSPARLNLGDCFAYALAVDRNEPLLYKGDDFAHTDIRSALA